MKKNQSLPALKKIIAKAPSKPGIYRWLNSKGDVLYVGKAKNIRNRLKSYITSGKGMGPWKESLMTKVADLEVTVTANELEALILETNLIKELKPKYNVLMKDGKNYVYVRIAVQDVFPSVQVVRKMETDDAKYFGPYLSAFNTRRLLEALHLAFPYRTSKHTIEKLNRLVRDGEDPDKPIYKTPPLECQIGKDCGLGTGSFKQKQYLESIDQLLMFFKGDHKPAMDQLQKEMQKAASEKKFEKAVELRDTIKYVKSLKEQQIVAGTTGENIDAIGVALLKERAQVTLLRQRGGKLIGEFSFALAGQPETKVAILDQFIPQYYSTTVDIPEMILVSEKVGDRSVLEKWLTERHGRKVEVLVPERGEKAKLMAMAEENARSKAQQQLARWEAAAKNVEDALNELKKNLSLSGSPKRIEGYDISHLGGTETVGSMVVFKNGKSANDQYRSFTIKTMKEGEIDDYKALKEVLSRRLLHLLNDLRQEEAKWKTEGLTFGKARKTECDAIKSVIAKHPKDLHLPDPFLHQEYIVARNGSDLVGFVRLSKVGTCLEAKSLWVLDIYRGKRLGHFLLKKLMNRYKKDKIYITTDPKLHEYYAEEGFRHVQNPPKSIQDELDEAKKEGLEFANVLVMVSLPSDRKLDSSLSDCPDLLVIDGGKGQLSAVASVLKELKLEIPLIALAKREEEVFMACHGELCRTMKVEQVTLPENSQARFLLMRLRDEAHRFANRHREGRGAKKEIASSLDDVPGIGEMTKKRLLKEFGSATGIRRASDSQLLLLLNEEQLKAVRRMDQ